MLSVDAKQYEAISKKHSPVYSQMLEAVKIVRDFIITRKLIIYGGSAIDFALRLFGDKIYPDEVLEFPDYDMYSPDNVEDSFDLADELYKANFTNVRVIKAFHVQTMKVDIEDKHFVADISYMPRAVYDNIPTLTYNDVRIVHPDFQRIDLHSSLSYPYDGPPREVIFSRWKKDITRFNLLNKYYPIKYDKEETRMIEVTIPLWVKQFVFSGFAAYALIYKSLELLFEAVNKTKRGGDKLVISADIPNGGLRVANNNIAYLSAENACEIVSFNVDQCTEYIKHTMVPSKVEVSHYESVADFVPEMYIAITQDIPVIKIMNIYGRLISSASIEIDTITNLRFVNIQAVMKYFLSMRYFAKEHNNVYLRYYLACCDTIHEAERAISELDVEKNIIDELTTNSPFFLTSNIYGSKNESESYLLMYRAVQLDLRMTVKPYVTPRGYKPAQGGRPNKFDYETSQFFRRSGKLIS